MYQNAGTVAVQYLIGQLVSHKDFDQAAGPSGFAQTYYALWGNPFAQGDSADVIPGELIQPEMSLPFAANQQWALTGGPHPGWGTNLPWSALDIAPPEGETHCANSERWVTAAAPGVVVRANDHAVVLDLDGDGYEQTGWVLFHFHMAERDLITSGKSVKTGDLLGHPSCEGGQATGTHVHLARKYNGEWIPADGIIPGVVPFDLGGWIPQRGPAPYLGRLTRLGAWVEACTCGTAANKIYWVP
jgi:murein DD-endopeptidase MepM/ murein hydrolase activator NlpD